MCVCGQGGGGGGGEETERKSREGGCRVAKIMKRTYSTTEIIGNCIFYNMLILVVLANLLHIEMLRKECYK